MFTFTMIRRRVIKVVGLDFNCQAKAEIAAADEAIARVAVARFSRGNVPIQHGFFQTPAQLEKERAEASKLKF